MASLLIAAVVGAAEAGAEAAAAAGVAAGAAAAAAEGAADVAAAAGSAAAVSEAATTGIAAAGATAGGAATAAAVTTAAAEIGSDFAAAGAAAGAAIESGSIGTLASAAPVVTQTFADMSAMLGPTAAAEGAETVEGLSTMSEALVNAADGSLSTSTVLDGAADAVVPGAESITEVTFDNAPEMFEPALNSTTYAEEGGAAATESSQFGKIGLEGVLDASMNAGQQTIVETVESAEIMPEVTAEASSGVAQGGLEATQIAYQTAWESQLASNASEIVAFAEDTVYQATTASLEASEISTSFSAPIAASIGEGLLTATQSASQVVASITTTIGSASALTINVAVTSGLAATTLAATVSVLATQLDHVDKEWGPRVKRDLSNFKGYKDSGHHNTVIANVAKHIKTAVVDGFDRLKYNLLQGLKSTWTNPKKFLKDSAVKVFMSWLKGDITVPGLPEDFKDWVRLWLDTGDINSHVALELKALVQQHKNTNPVLYGFMLLLGNLIAKYLEPHDTGAQYYWFKNTMPRFDEIWNLARSIAGPSVFGSSYASSFWVKIAVALHTVLSMAPDARREFLENMDVALDPMFYGRIKEQVGGHFNMLVEDIKERVVQMSVDKFTSFMNNYVPDVTTNNAYIQKAARDLTDQMHAATRGLCLLV